MPEGHDTTIEVSNIMSFVLYTQILKQSVLKPASPGITLSYNYHTNKTMYGSDLASLTDTVASLYTNEKVKHSVRKSIPNKVMCNDIK